ncbi:hypothetical protein [Aneurinibacillus tyrosinisolvens]|uniref:hypothetical protein n=1 Tax=Aneurinibacillus tyrosinisolvens TaxID=1443435 RepID=UPI00063F17B9|nr:hypothetical protein [Aneurinibacillus tyrosinisolvens]
MEKQAFVNSMASLPDPALRLVVAMMGKANVIELLSGKLAATFEREAAALTSRSRNDLILALLLKFNRMIHNEKVMYTTKEDLVHNTLTIVNKAIQELEKAEKEFQGDTLFDLFVYEGEKVEQVRHEEKEIELQANPELLAIYLQRLYEPDLGMLPVISNQRLRERILPFALYCIFLWGKTGDVDKTEEAVQEFLNFWQEKKGIYDHMKQKMDEHTYSIELEERLLEQKQGNIKVLQKQLDQIADEREQAKLALGRRLPQDINKFQGVFEGKAKLLLTRLGKLEEKKQTGEGEAEEGLLRMLWHRIDSTITDAQAEKESKRLALKLVDEMIAMKREITTLPLYYMDRIKTIHDFDSKIQEIRRWRYQLDQEVQAHKDTIAHHKTHRGTLEQQLKNWEKEYFLS